MTDGPGPNSSALCAPALGRAEPTQFQRVWVESDCITVAVENMMWNWGPGAFTPEELRELETIERGLSRCEACRTLPGGKENRRAKTDWCPLTRKLAGMQDAAAAGDTDYGQEWATRLLAAAPDAGAAVRCPLAGVPGHRCPFSGGENAPPLSPRQEAAANVLTN
jgi:hypothetical protein